MEILKFKKISYPLVCFLSLNIGFSLYFIRIKCPPHVTLHNHYKNVNKLVKIENIILI